MAKNAAEVNGRFREVQEIKAHRGNLKTQEDARNEEVMAYIKKNGPVLVYKGEKALILDIKPKTVKKLDKARLAEDLGMSVKQLSVATMAKMVEEGQLTSSKIQEYESIEVNDRLSQKKATKKEIAYHGNQR